MTGVQTCALPICRSFAVGDGTSALGERSFAANGFTIAQGDSSSAFGSYAVALGVASFAGGNNASGFINLSALGEASFAFGKAIDGSSLVAQGIGSFALGYSGDTAQTDPSNINSVANGSFAFGRTLNEGSILASSEGSLAGGFANDSLQINSTGIGSFVWGSTQSGALTVNAISAQAFGSGHNIIGNYASAFGVGHNISAYYCFVVGKYSTTIIGGDSSIDPAFVVGNGVDDSNRNNAFEIDRDGKLITTGAQKHKAIKKVSADYSISERTDRTILVDSTVDQVVLTLPVGEDGLEYFIKDVGYNADANNIFIHPSVGNFIEDALVLPDPHAGDNVISNNFGIKAFNLFAHRFH